MSSFQTPPRLGPKVHRSHEVFRQRAINQFMSASKDKRARLQNLLRNNSASESDKSEAIKSWLIQGNAILTASPSSVSSSAVAPNDFDWEDFVSSPEYHDLIIELEARIHDELLLEYTAEDLLPEDECYAEELNSSGFDCDVDPNAILCPFCWQSFLHKDSYTGLLLCKCGVGISLNSKTVGRQLTETEFKDILCNIHERHSSYCSASYSTSNVHQSGPNLRFFFSSDGLVAHCNCCGFHEFVL